MFENNVNNPTQLKEKNIASIILWKISNFSNKKNPIGYGLKKKTVLKIRLENSHNTLYVSKTGKNRLITHNFVQFVFQFCVASKNIFDSDILWKKILCLCHGDEEEKQ